MRTSLSVTPGVLCACSGGETTKRHPRSTPRVKTYFGVSFFISLSVLNRGPCGRNFYTSCLVLCSRDVNAFGVQRSVAVSVKTHGRYLMGTSGECRRQDYCFMRGPNT